ncbi:MAG: hypothetical protein N4A33_10025 [Bacteriovoracaceae bacterium]|jgi:hypothetical protein|nr:hypothetical protein [Bacteriovoracaceae bacterium]
MRNLLLMTLLMSALSFAQENTEPNVGATHCDTDRTTESKTNTSTKEKPKTSGSEVVND